MPGSLNPLGLIKEPLMPDPGKTFTRIRPRAFVLGLVFAVGICVLTPYNNVFKNATPLGGGYFPLAPFYFLFFLTLGVAVIRKLFKHRSVLTGSELLVTWILMVIVSGIAYTGFARTFFINLTAPFYFATVENQWQEILNPLLPADLFPGDSAAIALLYNGIDHGRSMGWMAVAEAVPWAAWIKPFLSWGVFMMICYFLMLCLVSLINRQAVTNERMNFPLLIVPTMIQKALDQDRLASFFGNRFLLTGLSIPVFLHLLNGLNFYFPSIPQISTLVLAGPYIPKQGIFTGFAKLKLYFYPAFIGFAFLASKQVSFSFWFFFIFGSLVTGILGVAGFSYPASELGTTFGPTLTQPEETQMIGAFIVFFFFLIWLARHHLATVAGHALFLKRDSANPGHRNEDTLAFWGTVMAGGAMLAWFLAHGVCLGPALGIIGFFFMFVMVATRVVCQGGVTYFTLTVAPLDAINTLVGFKVFSSVGLLLAGISQKVAFTDLRESVMPSLLHARRVTRQADRQGLILFWIFFTMVVCLFVSAVAMILLCYKYGIRELQLDWATRTTVSMYNNLIPLIRYDVAQGDSIRWFAAIGAVVMAVLAVGYHRFYWWPLHPIGYLMLYSSAMKILWLSFFIGWLFNTVCMHYGGVSLFKKMRYFFVGMIMGDFLMGGTWALIGLFCTSSYQVLPA